MTSWDRALPNHQRPRAFWILLSVYQQIQLRIFCRGFFFQVCQPCLFSPRDFYQPAVLHGNFLVDGAILSNFPIDSFDDTADWPTFGVKLSAKESATISINRVTNPVNFTTAIFNTMMEAHDRIHLDEPSTAARTIFIDTLGIHTTDFDIKPNQQQALFASGQAAGSKFLKTWNYRKYQEM